MKIDKSRDMFERAKETLAGGVGAQVRSLAEPHPLYFDHGAGSRIFDIDGNEYIDYLLAYGPLILGHCPPPVVGAVRAQLARGTAFGAPHEPIVQLAEKLVEVVPCYDLVRVNNSGSEAVHAVQRVARAYTGKYKIVKFEGHYHGWYDNIYISHLPDSQYLIGLENAPRTIVESSGQPESVRQDVIVASWNRLDLIEKTIKAHKHEIAAVLTEPIMSNCGVIPPKEGYLEGLREITRDIDVLLIFDEVITGHRIALGGAQEYYGVMPDLAVFAKALGGGYPIVSWGGRKDIMDLVAQKKTVHAGTFNANPLCASAALATLTELQKGGKALYERLTGMGRKLMAGIAELARKADYQVRLQGPGPMFGLSFRDPGLEMTNFRDSFAVAPDLYPRFRRALLEEGVHIFPSEKGLWYISAAHTDEDIDLTLERVEAAFKKM